MTLTSEPISIEQLADWAPYANPARLAEHLSGGRYVAAPHHEILSDLIVRATMDGDVRAIVAMPPRHGKSYMVSYYGPVWVLSQNPESRIVIASYASDFAMSWGRRIRDCITEHAKELGVSVADDSKAANRWHTGKGEGGVVTAGIAGQITGKGVDLLIIDDPIKNAEEAMSEVKRETAWRFWTDTAHSRMEDKASVIVTMTRWHEDDLVGRLIDDGGWEVISLPALAEDDDPLGRKRGEALWPDHYAADCKKFLEVQRYNRTWASLYQQRPAPEEGAMFKREHFRSWTDDETHYHLPQPDGSVKYLPKSQTWIAQTCDTAFKTGTENDYTVVLTFAYGQGSIIILDVMRDRLEVPDQWPMLVRQRERWPDLLCQAVEDRGSGTGLIQEAERTGYPLKPLKPDVDKTIRAVPLAIAYESGNVYHPRRAHWLGDFESELLVFNAGAHDDQVDCAAYAALLVQEFSGNEGGPIIFRDPDPDHEGWEEPARDRFDEAFPL